MNTATLITESNDCGTVASALNVDNIKLDGLEIKTSTDNNKIITQIKAKDIKTLLVTLDDILFCQMVAEKSINKK
jgi:transcriptional/translational regulatory protein YebC/TACO1